MDECLIKFAKVATHLSREQALPILVKGPATCVWLRKDLGDSMCQRFFVGQDGRTCPNHCGTLAAPDVGALETTALVGHLVFLQQAFLHVSY